MGEILKLGEYTIEIVRGKAGKVNILKNGEFQEAIYLDLKKLEWVCEIEGFIPAKQVIIKEEHEYISREEIMEGLIDNLKTIQEEDYEKDH